MKTITECLNCGHWQGVTEGKNTWHDSMGDFTVCEECGSSYDIELRQQQERSLGKLKR